MHQWSHSCQIYQSRPLYSTKTVMKLWIVDGSACCHMQSLYMLYVHPRWIPQLLTGINEATVAKYLSSGHCEQHQNSYETLNTWPNQNMPLRSICLPKVGTYQTSRRTHQSGPHCSQKQLVLLSLLNMFLIWALASQELQQLFLITY
jgi:hypothetical protein